MKKIILLVLVFIAGFFAWRYFKNPERKPTTPEQAIDAAANYVPDIINRKNAMENKIKDSAAQESERIKNSLEELQ